jgi:hypothetical protein
MQNLTVAKLQPEGCPICSILVRKRPQTSGADFILYTHKSPLQSVLVAAKSGCQGCHILLFAVRPFVKDWDGCLTIVYIGRSYYGHVFCEISGGINPTIRVEVNKRTERSGSYSTSVHAYESHSN